MDVAKDGMDVITIHKTVYFSKEEAFEAADAMKDAFVSELEEAQTWDGEQRRRCNNKS